MDHPRNGNHELPEVGFFAIQGSGQTHFLQS
jgi:hypothetical protein